jgi:hypothetical protein
VVIASLLAGPAGMHLAVGAVLILAPRRTAPR